MSRFGKYRLINQRKDGYNGNYKKLFAILEKDSIFSECFAESETWEGDDMIIETTWSHEPCDKLPKGVIELN